MNSRSMIIIWKEEEFTKDLTTFVCAFERDVDTRSSGDEGVPEDSDSDDGKEDEGKLEKLYVFEKMFLKSWKFPKYLRIFL